MIINPKDHRFTQERELDRAKEFAGVGSFTLDVAAHPSTLCAQWFYAPHELMKGARPMAWVGGDGLSLPWFGHVWCNPPFSKLEPWLQRAWSESIAGTGEKHGTEELMVQSVTMLLPANRTEQPWWHRWVEPYLGRSIEPTPMVRNLPRASWPPLRRVTLSLRHLKERSQFDSPDGPPKKKRTPFFACLLLNWRVEVLP
jgi:hypothetical protein